MSLKQDLTYTAVIGSKENIIRMLNAAIRNVGTGNEIVDGDDIEEINRKIKEQDGKFNLRIALPDLLEDAVLQEDWVQEKQAEFASRDTQEECDDEEYYDDEMSTNERMISIEGVYEEGGRYRAEFILYECENSGYYADWLDWGDIARIYNCTVFVDNDLYENGSFYKYCSTRVFREKNDSVTETRIEPNLNIYEYASCLERLSDMYPARYRERIIRSMEAQIRDLQYEIARERIKIIRETLDENNGHAVIPEGTREIPEAAFRNCSKLRSVEIPEGVVNIGTRAFAGCENLKSIQLPASLKNFSLNAFIDCNIESIIVHPDNEEFCSEGNCILSKDREKLILGFKTSVIPSSVTTIGVDAFFNDSYLEDIVITSNVKKIEENAFCSCSKLRSVIVSEGVEEIGNNAFDSCENLREIKLPSGLLKIGGRAFFGCTSLSKIDIPESVSTIYAGAFGCCSSLREIVIPDSATIYLKDDTFQQCTSLERIVLPSTLTEIGRNAFRDCSSLSEIVIPEEVSSIGIWAFKDCTSLEKIVLPYSVTEIGAGAFDGCPCLEDLKEMYPDLIKDIPEDWIRKEPETGNNDLIDENGYAVIPDGTEEIEDMAFSNCKGLVSIEIPESIRAIGMSAFENCSGLTSVKLPSNLKKIYLGAFMDCTGLTSIIIPDGVKEIFDCAFKGCSSLTEVTIPEGVKVSFDAFDGCPYQEQFESEYLDKKKDDVKKEDDEDLPF